MKSKEKRLRRKRRLERRAQRPENVQARHEQAKRIAAEWSEFVEELRAIRPDAFE